jgi:hypothetical protein
MLTTGLDNKTPRTFVHTCGTCNTFTTLLKTCQYQITYIKLRFQLHWKLTFIVNRPPANPDLEPYHTLNWGLILELC